MTRLEIVARLRALIARGCFLPDARRLALLLLRQLTKDER